MKRVFRFLRREMQAMLGLRYGYFRRRRNRFRAPILLWWWFDGDYSACNSIKNFGDEFSYELVHELFGYRVQWANIENCELICIGSILEHLLFRDPPPRGGKKIWGSGFIQDGAKPLSVKNEYYAVRGKMTEDRLILKHAILGDPGILANIVFPASRKKNHKIGVVVHYIDLDLPIIQKLQKDRRFLVISALQPAAEVAKQISSCKYIFSSSLHGLIFADSYNVPNAHVAFSDKVIGGDYKFRDYCSGVNREYLSIKPKELFDDKKVKEVIAKYRPIRHKRRIQRNLIKAFPYK